MTKAQIFINTDLRNPDGTISENWISADINPDVNITVKDKIKDSKDVGKVFAAYTNQFKLPASKTNNRIFKRFANPNIFDGFDPRRKYDAIIKLNGVDFKKGYIKLNTVNLKDNNPVSYSVQFFGEITSLKDILSDIKLKDLRLLSNFRYENTASNVRTGFEKGFNVELSSGSFEQTYIAITGGATSSGFLRIELDGEEYDIEMSANSTIAETAIAIALFVNVNVSDHSATIIQQNNVLIYANEVGTKVNSTINVFSTGVLATLTTLVQGENEGSNESDGLVLENSNGDFKYSLISHTTGFEYDDDGFHRILSLEERDDNYVVTSDDRLDFTDLKPSMKIKLIFDAIEEMFPMIRFNKEWLFGEDAGVRQLSKIAFAIGASSSGNITVSLNGVDYLIELPVGSSGAAAEAVSDAVNNITGYVASVSNIKNVIIQSESYGPEQEISVTDTDSTGAVSTASTEEIGVLSAEKEGGSTLKDLYIWLHNRKGAIGYESTTGDVERNQVIRTLRDNGAGADQNEWEYLSGDGDLRTITNESVYESTFDYTRQSHRIKVTIPSASISPSNSGDVTVKIDVYEKDTNIKYKTKEKTFSPSEDIELIADIPFRKYKKMEYYVAVVITADSTVNTYKPLLELTKTTKVKTSINLPETITTLSNNFAFFDNSNDVYSNLSYINPQRLMPDMKIIDFLSDIFKTYNLVAFEERLDDNSFLINVKSYDDYLDSGKQYDITNYVDIESSTVSRISPFKSVEYNYSKPTTFLAINQKEITGDDFGNVKFNVNNFDEEGMDSSNSLLFDGNTYKVEPKFEKMMFERLVNVDSSNLTNYQWGWFVADNRGDNFPNPTIGKPLLHYINNRKAVVGHEILWRDGVPSADYYNAPSNVDDSGLNTTHFNAEFNEWDRNINENSIFKNFHLEYIQGIYSAYAKRFEVKAYLPPAIFSKLQLNDTLIIDRISYIIDSMDININKALTKLNLLRVTDTFKVFEGTPESEQDTFLSFKVVTTSADEVVELPYASNSTYSGTVFWGDGETSVNTYSEREHTYAVAGEYTIKIAGEARVIDFGAVNRTPYTELVSFGEESSLDRLDLVSFGSNFDMSNVLDKPNFRAFSSFCMSGTNGTVNLIEQWDVSNVIDLSSAFSNSNFNQSIGGWDVSNVTNMFAMFSNNTTFNKYIADWDVGVVATMEGMFNNTTFSGNLSKWNTINVKSMKQMFQNTDYNGSVHVWDVDNVEDMSSMFAGNGTFNKNVGLWNVENVKNMSGMFYDATSFSNDISSWNLASIEDMSLFMPSHEYDTTYYSNLLQNLDASGVTNVTLDFNFTTYFGFGATSTSRASLVSKGWTITDLGPAEM